MKDWRGVFIELAIIAAMCFAMWLDHALAMPVVTALAAWGGLVIQRAKIDALVGVSMAPPPVGGGGSRLSLRVPVYKTPRIDSQDGGDSHANGKNQ